MQTVPICIVGGGAAGMMAAIWAARCGVEVLLIERNSRVGKKLLATGNGKCNFTNRQMAKDCYYGSLAEGVEAYFAQVGVEDILSFFADCGMLWKEKNGYCYPYSEQAATVLDTLRFMLDTYGVKVLYDTTIDQISQIDQRNQSPQRKEKENKVFLLQNKGKTVVMARQVILATGGLASPGTGSDGLGLQMAKALGLTIEPPAPALTKFICQDACCKEFAGVRSEAKVSLFLGDKLLATEAGEVQFTDYGLSGIPIFQISRLVSTGRLQGKKGYRCEIDFFPKLTSKALEELYRKKEMFCVERGLSGEVFLNGLVQKKIAGYFGKQIGVSYQKPMRPLTAENRKKLISLSKAFPFSITDVKGFEQAQVSAGGVISKEVDEGLESRKLPGLFLAGEMLDIDGKCGGYNLQWAFSSGAIVGLCAAKREKEKS